MSEMPEAQNCGCSSAPGICLRNSGANSPMHGRGVHADLLEHAAVHHAHDAAATRRTGMIGPLPRRALGIAPGRGPTVGRPPADRPRASRGRRRCRRAARSNQAARRLFVRGEFAPPRASAPASSAMPARFLEPFCWRNSPYISPAAMSRGASPAGTPKTRKNITICARLARPEHVARRNYVGALAAPGAHHDRPLLWLARNACRFHSRPSRPGCRRLRSGSSSPITRSRSGR